jgi:thymidine kinase
MFSGKSSELIRRLRRALFAKQRVVAFKHGLDQRYHPRDIGSHAGSLFESLPVSSSAEILESLRGREYDVVGVDEGQFFDEGLIQICQDLADAGKIVIVAGLDMDSDGRPFGPMPSLLAVADVVDKIHAVCVVCGQDASRSFHHGEKVSTVEVGVQAYEARCRTCARTT